MQKRTQNHVAESRFTLPVVVAYSIAVWLVSGQLITTLPITSTELLRGAWVQFVCFLVSAYLMVELNNSNALIRIYSRTVSCSFIVMSCAASFLFSSMAGAIAQLGVIAATIALFRTYQDKLSVGWTFYAFLFVGLATAVCIQVLFYVPLLWMLMFFQLTSLSWRTFCASLIGLITPYWFALPLFIYEGQLPLMANHFAALVSIPFPYDYTSLSLNQILLFAFVVALAITGTIHYWRNKSSDNIRIRLLYGCFIMIWMLTTVFIVLQPQHYDILIRILIINASPVIAHFLSLTYTRVTNIAFYVVCASALLLTLLNLWMPSLHF